MKSWGMGLTIVTVLVVGSAFLCHAQEAPKTTTPPATEEPAAKKPASEEGKTEKEKRERKPVDFAGEGLRVDLEKDMYYLTGNVVFTQETTKLHCDQAEYSGKENTAKATGNLKIVDKEETTVTGDKINADFDKELAVITGNVVLVTQKKGEAAADASKAEKEKHKKTTLTCDKIEYYYGEGRAVATGNLKVVHEDKTVTGDVGVYLEKDEVATVTGNVKLVDDKGRHMECEKATVSTTEDWAEFEGVKGKWWKTEEKTEGTPETKPPAEGETPPPAEQPPSAPAATETQPPPAQ